MTPEERAKVTPEEMASWLTKVVTTNPDRVNPTVRMPGGDRRCLYTDLDDPACHCVVGEMLAQHDPDLLPLADSHDNLVAVGAYGLLAIAGYAAETATIAASWQRMADSGTIEYGGTPMPVRWGEALERMRSEQPEAVK